MMNPAEDRLTLSKATLKHAIELSKNLREADYREVKALTGKEPIYSLVAGVLLSDLPVAILEGDKVLGMFGVVPNQGKGVVWLLGSDRLVSEYKRRFLKESKAWLNVLLEKYKILHNVIDSRNTLHIRWLKWMGFQFINEIPDFGPEKITVYEFISQT